MRVPERPTANDAKSNSLGYLSSGLASLLFTIMTEASLAQQSTTEGRPPPPLIANPSKGSNLTEILSRDSSLELWLTGMIIAFGVLALLLFIYNVGKVPEKIAGEFSRSFIVITVIVAALILITAGYSNQQIAPAFGLFGTIVGYVLGRLDRSGQSEKQIETSAELKSNVTPTPRSEEPS